MVMPTATITSKGQTTIPKEVRDALGLHAGDKIDFVIDADGKKATVLPVTLDARNLRGILKPKRKQRVTLEEMEAAIASGAAEGMRKK
jgi:antitoxin PrlF